MLKKIIILGLVAVLILFFKNVVDIRSNKLTLDNAYISGRIIDLKSKASGMVNNIHIAKGQMVKKGDILFDFYTEEKDIEIDNLVQELRISINDELQSCLNSKMLEEKIERSQAQLSYLTAKKNRLTQLTNLNALPKEEIIDLDNSIELERKNQSILKIELDYETQNFAVPLLQKTGIKKVLNSLEEAHYNRFHLQQFAPEDGYIYDVLTYSQHYVDTDTSLAVFLPMDKIFIEANVLESNIEELSEGKEVEVYLDTSSDEVPLIGKIHSIVPATASSFSVLPQNNTDSNWVKVTQRIPILIEIISAKKQLLSIGSSVSVVINKGSNEASSWVSTQEIDELPKLDNATPWRSQFQQQVQEVMSSELSKVAWKKYDNCQLTLTAAR